MIIQTQESLDAAVKFITEADIIAFDIETTGLNKRKDRIMGIGIGTADRGFYFPISKYNAASDTCEADSFGTEAFRTVASLLLTKKLLTWNAAFDMPFTKNYLGIDLLPALFCDGMLLKHTCDEEFPFGLKDVASMHWGIDVKKEKEEMLASIKKQGGTATQFYKADVQLLAKYCIADCALTYRLYLHYMPQLRRDGLIEFFFEDT